MSEAKRVKPHYKTTNWAAYNAALKARGSLTIWLDKDMQWYAPASGKRGRQQVFSDAAIQFCLSIKCLFGLALRQSLLRLAHLDWKVPDFSTVSRRQKTLQVQLPYQKWSGYHRRSLVETKMHCFKRLGERVMARTFERQVVESHVRVALLNRFTQLGRPVTVAVPAVA